MIFEVFIALIIGIISGCITGLIPGIHINLIVAALLSLTIPEINQYTLIVYITSLAITHTFIDFIPSIYFGASGEDSVVSILPGHRYLLEGKGEKAVFLTVIGSVIAIISLIIVIPSLYFLIKIGYDFFEKMIGYFLLIAIIFLISQEKDKLITTIIVFLLSGFLGIITLNSSINEPLLPLLSGLFGASTLISSINQKTKVPKQKKQKIRIKISKIIKPTYLTIIVSPICSLLPGLGSSQAAVISSKLTKKISREEFLILLGSINTLVISTSFLTLYLIGRTRTGASYAISQITNISFESLILIIITMIITSIIATPLTLFISRLISKRIDKVNYTLYTKIILFFISLIIIIISGFNGFFIYLNGAIIGLLAIKSEISKSHLMGCILLPTTLYYIPF